MYNLKIRLLEWNEDKHQYFQINMGKKGRKKRDKSNKRNTV